MARLRVEQGKSKGKQVEFEKTAVIGRGESAQLQISDIKASREHCKVFEQAGTWSVADLNSTNGIIVNGVKTTRKTLSPGDKIEIGETVVVFELTPAARTSAAAADTGDMPAVKAAPKSAAAPPAKPAAAPSGASAKKAEAMAQARAAASPKAGAAPGAKPAAGKPAAAGTADKGLKISDHVLQFHKVDAKKAGLGDIDLDQSPTLTKILIFLGCVGFIVLLLWLIYSFLGEK